ncbi:hypothetical protein Cni_G23784 [Canna indica]|uniref:Transcription factor AS1 n=1 Tax=Canna indica TaxID=4628 RepID=A0AAQ3KU35_9LILI|nr:hypothetical protein Cni_G23784 [Canna indica]
MATPFLPPWLSNKANAHGPPSPSVTLTLSPSVVPPAPKPWLQAEHGADSGLGLATSQHGMVPRSVDGRLMPELVEYFRELEEGHRAWMEHKKEAAWRLKRLELQLESEKACKRREKMEEIEAKVRALREEQQVALERIEAEYKEQIAGLRKDAEVKEQKLVELWAAKHMRLSKFLEQVGCRQWPPADMNGR